MLDTKRREFIALLGAGGPLLAVKVKRARGQQPAMPLVGWLSARSPREAESILQAVLQGLGEAGYLEGKNVTIELTMAHKGRSGA